jgi:hypothetical protein
MAVIQFVACGIRLFQPLVSLFNTQQLVIYALFKSFPFKNKREVLFGIYVIRNLCKLK